LVLRVKVAVDLRATVQENPRSEIADYQQKPKEPSLHLEDRV
jgi:hypothetical protein